MASEIMARFVWADGFVDRRAVIAGAAAWHRFAGDRADAIGRGVDLRADAPPFPEDGQEPAGFRHVTFRRVTFPDGSVEYQEDRP